VLRLFFSCYLHFNQYLWFANNNRSAHNELTVSEMALNSRTKNGALVLSVIRFVRLLLTGHQALAIENAALRLQLVAFQRRRKRPVLTTLDRVFWITLRRLWSDLRRALIYVRPTPLTRIHAWRVHLGFQVLSKNKEI
jgi:hypothetical protein